MNLRKTFLKLLHYLLSSSPVWRFDFLAFFIILIVSYRKDVVFQNVSNSFPETNEKGINQLGANFYRNLADLIVEQTSSSSDFEITNQCVLLLEQSIYNNPDNWLYSRRRWKLSKEETEY